MSRPHNSRRVYGPPRFISFKPAGIPRRQLDPVLLRVDEFEAMRLTDYEGLDQRDAAAEMGISPATFSRVLKSARFSLMRAIIEGKGFDIDGGKIDYLHTFRRCSACGDEVMVQLQSEITSVRTDPLCCRRCGSGEVEDLVELLERREATPLAGDNKKHNQERTQENANGNR